MLRDEVQSIIIYRWLRQYVSKTFIFMQDKALPQFAVVVHEWLNAQYSGKPMGCRGLHKWPAKTPNLIVNNLELFSLGCLNEQVYSTKPRNLEKFEGRIRKVLTTIPEEFF